MINIVKLNQTLRCCICSRPLRSEFDMHNPWPLGCVNQKCCARCNGKFVLPARIVRHAEEMDDADIA
jgi:hypothetical protein